MRLFSNHYLGRGADPDDEMMFADEFFYAIDVDNSMEIDFSEFLWFMLWQVVGGGAMRARGVDRIDASEGRFRAVAAARARSRGV